MIKKILLMVILTMAISGCTAEDIAIWKEVSRERRNLRIGECLDNGDGTASCKNEYGNVIRVPIRR
jgi:alpha-neurotoxin NTX-1